MIIKELLKKLNQHIQINSGCWRPRQQPFSLLQLFSKVLLLPGRYNNGKIVNMANAICSKNIHLFDGVKVANEVLKKDMQLQDDKDFPKYSQEEETNSPDIIEANENAEAEEDTDPPLDEEDLEENNLSVEEADQIVWEPPQKSSSGSEEKDITD